MLYKENKEKSSKKMKNLAIKRDVFLYTVAVTLEKKPEGSVGTTTIPMRELFPLEVRFDI